MTELGTVWVMMMMLARQLGEAQGKTLIQPHVIEPVLLRQLSSMHHARVSLTPHVEAWGAGEAQTI